MINVQMYLTSVCTTTCVTPNMKKVQRILNVLLPGTKYAIPLYTNTSEVIECIYGSSIECLNDEQGNETEMVVMKAGRDTSGIIMNKWLINQIDIKCWH